ncbi:MAG TPA: hypothetical protein VIT21_03385 [Chthoniobacterales bacterium]
MKYPLVLLGALLMATAPTAFAQDTKKIVLGFENGLEDFTGDVEQDATVGKTGSGSAKMVAELADVETNAWTTAKRSLDLPGKIQSLSFWLKSADANSITVRIVDSTGQVHQSRPGFVPSDDWQEIRIEAFDTGRRYQHFEGANDGQVHWPATTLAFIIEKGALLSGNGTIWIDDVEIVPENAQ